MLTPEQFVECDLNTLIEVGTVFENLSSEPVVWICQERGKHPDRGTEVAVFGLYYFGIDIGRMRGELTDDGVQWKEVA